MLVHRRSKSLNKQLVSVVPASPFKNNTLNKLWCSSGDLFSKDTHVNNSIELMPILQSDENTISSDRNSSEQISEDTDQVVQESTVPRSNMINEMIINILEDIDGNNPNTNQITSSSQTNNVNEKINEYKITIFGYFYYCLLSVGIPSMMNALTEGSAKLNADILFNLYISPLIYKICFRHHFLQCYKYNKKKIIVYFIFYMIGFSFRFLDNIKYLQTFVLNTAFFDYNDPIHVVLFLCITLYLLSTFIYEIRDTVCWKLNIAILIFGLIFVFVSLNQFVKQGIIYHFHHFFVGLIFHIVCQRYNKYISLINNAIGFGIYIEGVSRWGYGRIIFT